MASVGIGSYLTASLDGDTLSSLRQGDVTSKAKVSYQVKVQATTKVSIDSANLSQVSKVLSGVVLQIEKSGTGSLKEVLSDAATMARAEAQIESDPTQADALDNLAGRLEAAASSAASVLSANYLTLLLGD